MTPLRPGSVIGILGGGQLGRLLALAAGRLGFDVHVYCPQADCPAARVAAQSVVADHDNAEALARFAADCDVITYEFENVPARTVEQIEVAGGLVRPGVKALEVAQDRLVEKNFLNGLNIPTVGFVDVQNFADLEAARKQIGSHCVLKTRREGYDGKGQVTLGGVRGKDGREAAARLIAKQACLLEAFAPFEREISVIVVRGSDGQGGVQALVFDPSDNRHEGGILKRCVVPARISEAVHAAAIEAGTRLAEALDYIGVLALEFFVMPDGQLLANEMAPRVHNSGHWTPEACLTGQFEQHIRAVAGWPLGPVTRIFDIEMENLLGEEVQQIPNGHAADARLVPYGKREPRAGRKMAHVTRRSLRGSLREMS